VRPFSTNEALWPAIVSTFQPIGPNKSWSAADKQMDMVRHNHIAANYNTDLVRGALSKENKCSMNFMASQTCSSVMRAKGDKVERVPTKNSAET